MAATYLCLISNDLLHGPQRIPWPRCLHLGKTTLSERHPGMWVVEITDDDAPEELNAQQVELYFTRMADSTVQVTGRQVVRF